MTKREINEAIYLTGQWDDYRVVCTIPDMALVCYTSKSGIGNAIVRALRTIALDLRANNRKES